MLVVLLLLLLPRGRIRRRPHRQGSSAVQHLQYEEGLLHLRLCKSQSLCSPCKIELRSADSSCYATLRSKNTRFVVGVRTESLLIHEVIRVVKIPNIGKRLSNSHVKLFHNGKTMQTPQAGKQGLANTLSAPNIVSAKTPEALLLSLSCQATQSTAKRKLGKFEVKH